MNYPRISLIIRLPHLHHINLNLTFPAKQELFLYGRLLHYRESLFLGIIFRRTITRILPGISMAGERA